MWGELWELEIYDEMRNLLIETTTIRGNTIYALMECVLGEFMILEKENHPKSLCEEKSKCKTTVSIAEPH